MKIQNWEGIALIIGTGDIGNSLSEYIKSISPKLDVITCGRDLRNQNSIFLVLQVTGQHGIWAVLEFQEDTLLISKFVIILFT